MLIIDEAEWRACESLLYLCIIGKFFNKKKKSEAIFAPLQGPFLEVNSECEQQDYLRLHNSLLVVLQTYQA